MGREYLLYSLGAVHLRSGNTWDIRLVNYSLVVEVVVVIVKRIVLITQFCLAPCDPINYSQPGTSVQGILQARILEWFAISLSGEEG